MSDDDTATCDALFAMVDSHLWPCAIAFVAGAYVTVGLAYVWSFFL
jgi:hypothetical protein